ncbi:MAG: SGNH/GDSL hydrolase family protein [Acidobacteriota bacterium]
MTKPAKPARPTWPSLLMIAAAVGIPFSLVIGFLGLHKLGRVGPVEGLTYEATLILNALLYWLFAWILAVALVHRGWALDVCRRQWPQFALLAFSLLLSGAFAEVAIRLVRPDLGMRPFERLASPTLHHVNAPNRSSLGMGNQRVVTNADGFRTAYSREEFLKRKERIVLLGDSYTFGLGVSAEDAVGVVLERRLKVLLPGEDSSIGVLNTGVISYSPFLEQQMFLERAAAYRPTLTLLLLDANDFGDDYQYAQENIAAPGESPRFPVPEARDDSGGICDLSALCRALGPVWDRLGKPAWVMKRLFGDEEKAYDYYDFEIQIAGQSERNRFFILRYPLEDSRPFLDSTWANIEAVAEAVRATGSEFALVVMPRYFHWNDAECPNNWESDRYGVDEPFENAYLEYFDERALGAASFPVWSLLRPFEEATGPLVFDHDPHWNAAGHRTAGEALAQWLVDDGWPAEFEGRPRLSWPQDSQDRRGKGDEDRSMVPRPSPPEAGGL